MESLDWKLAELYGIIVGDGYLHKNNYSIIVVCSSEESYYLKNRVMPLFEKLFNKTPYFAPRKDRNAYYIQINSKSIIEFFTKTFSMSRGEKSGYRISKKILKNKKLMSHFLRGLFDTDGCIKFSKQTRKFNYYPRIQFYFKNGPLSGDLESILSKLGFKYSSYEDHRFGGLRVIQISGSENLKKWVKVVGSANLVHITKILQWKKDGFVVPKTTLDKRIKRLGISTKTLLNCRSISPVQPRGED